MKKNNYFLTIVLFIAACVVAIANGPAPLVTIDTDQIIDGAVTILKTDGVAANDLSNVTPATGRAALGLGTMAVATSTDYVATSALALRLDTGNASFSEDIDVTGNVGAATVNGVAPLTGIEKTQALVGSTTVNFAAKNISAAAASFSASIQTGGGAIIATTTVDPLNIVNVGGNVAANTIVTRPLAAIGSPQVGQIYYDTDTHFYGWNGTAWKQLDN